MSTPQEYPQLGRYKVINKIATGGMAEVFLAKAVGAMGFQRLVAVKLIHSNFTRDAEFVKMFIDEARIAMHLHHRNIVQVFDLDKVAGTYFIAMEYVHGVNLYDVYERIVEHDRWIEPPLALYLVAEVCKGLHFAHTRTDSKGQPLTIIHRDISPQNVLLSFEGEVKITDFGIATAAQRLHQTAIGIVKGKYAYMAPERLQEEPIDARVDVFSCGVLLYELLAGENPFAGASAVETIENVLQRDVPAPSLRGARISSELDEICLKALARRPDDRFSDAMTMAEVLNEYAMDLTMARKDMAAGDAAVAQLLAELFPERATRPPVAAEPSSLVVPGVANAGSDVGVAPRPSFQAAAGPSDDDEDFDAPTVLRMDAVTGLDEVPTPRAPQPRQPTYIPSDESTGAQTAPTELPPAPPPPAMAFAPRQAPIEPHDAFAPTHPSEIGTETVPDDAAIPPVRAPIAWSPSMDRGVAHPAPSTRRPPHAPRTPPGRLGDRTPTGDRHEALVVPLESPTSGASSQRLNLIAAVLLVVAVIVVAAAVLTRADDGAVTEVPIAIQTQPPGAVVLLNGQRLARPTPVEASVRAQHAVTVQLELPGYQTVRRQVRARPGERLVVEEALRATEGRLIIIPRPAEAIVSVDGHPRGSGKVQINGLALDRPITIRVALDGYVAFEQALTLTADDPEQTLAVPLARRPRAGKPRPPATRKVRLTTPDGTWATVYYQGETLGSTPVDAILPIGNVTIRVRNDELNLNKKVKIRVPKTGSEEILLRL